MRVIAALLLLAACAVPGPPAADGNGWVRLPAEAPPWSLDPDRRAAFHIGATLTRPSRQAGNPAAQAEALGFYEYATVALNGPRWVGLDALAVPKLRQGRDELRDAYGIKRDAPAQVVLESFFKAYAALSVGDRGGAIRSFPPGILTGPGEDVIARLEAPPPMRHVELASAYASRSIDGTELGGGLYRLGIFQR